ncbi:hypothetical protein V6N13_135813 [Hibiscus sabdariffa]
MVQAWSLFSREGCLTNALGSEQGWIGGYLSWFCSWLLPLFALLFRQPFCLAIVGCLAVGFLSFRVSLLGSQATLKLTPARRARPSKAIWCLVFVVNDGALGVVAKPPVLDLLSIQVYGVHSRPSSFAPTTIVSPASMSALHLLFFLSFL